MLDMRQAAEQVLFLAEKKKLKDVDIVVERNESLDPVSYTHLTLPTTPYV